MTQETRVPHSAGAASSELRSLPANIQAARQHVISLYAQYDALAQRYAHIPPVVKRHPCTPGAHVARCKSSFDDEAAGRSGYDLLEAANKIFDWALSDDVVEKSRIAVEIWRDNIALQIDGMLADLDTSVVALERVAWLLVPGYR